MKKHMLELVFIGIAFSVAYRLRRALYEAAAQRREEVARAERTLLKGKIVSY